MPRAARALASLKGGGAKQDKGKKNACTRSRPDQKTGSGRFLIRIDEEKRPTSLEA